MVDRNKLTEKALGKLKPTDKRQRIWDGEISGFYALVTTGGRISFYLRYTLNGLVRDYPLGRWGSITLTEARKLAKQAAGRVAAGIDVHLERKQKRLEEKHKKHATLGAFIDGHHAAYLKTETRCGEKTLSDLRRCFGPWFKLPMSEISEWKVVRWRQDQLKLGLKNGSINRPVTHLRSALNHAFRRGVIDRHPLQHLRPLKEDILGRIRFLSPDEEKRLRKALLEREQRRRLERAKYNDWLRNRKQPTVPDHPIGGYTDHVMPLVLLAMLTGLRRGELLSLTWADYNKHAANLVVHGERAKSKRTRHVPLCSEAVDVIERWHRQCNTSGKIFTNPHTGDALKDFKKAWDRLRTAAKLTDFRFHDLRHHFASSLVMREVDLNSVRELLGHSDLKMTLRYAHLAPEHLARAVASLNRALP